MLCLVFDGEPPNACRPLANPFLPYPLQMSRLPWRRGACQGLLARAAPPMTPCPARSSVVCCTCGC